VFYPTDLRQGDWFTFYAQAFDTVEINNTFYRLPEASTFDAWLRRAPPGFIYAVKANRLLTHLKKLKDPRLSLDLFFDRARGLGGALGPVLYQLPPHWRLNLERFEEFLAALPQGWRHVVEFRDQSWLVDDVFRLMECRQVAHCIHDMTPLRVPPRVTAPFVYLRLHGNLSHAGDYEESQLQTWGRSVVTWRQQGLDVFVYFNNDIGGFAVKNALRLRAIVEGE
jgi:uncharacterized protein YecE (DUF72 family)